MSYLSLQRPFSTKASHVIEAYNKAMETRTLSSLLAIIMLVTLSATAAPSDRDEKCAKVKTDIRKLEARMRRGYTASQGVRFEERLRELKDKRYRLCR